VTKNDKTGKPFSLFCFHDDHHSWQGGPPV